MFEVVCRMGFKVKCTRERYLHIITRHPEILEMEKELKEALEDPDFVKASTYDKSVLLFYKSAGKEYIVVVAKNLGKEGFVITAYITDFVKEGEMVWKK